MARPEKSRILNRSQRAWRATPSSSLHRPCGIGALRSIMASRSFERPVTALQELREAVASYTARAAEKLRRQHLATASLMVLAAELHTGRTGAGQLGISSFEKGEFESHRRRKNSRLKSASARPTRASSAG
jgi:hypothetical protein